MLAEDETIDAIAARFNVSLGDLAELNGDRDIGSLPVGAEIAVGYGERVEHRVTRGETLLRIARRYGVSATDVARWNGLDEPRRMRADATLIIYAFPHIPPSSSIGRPSHGTLENGVRLRPSRLWVIHDRDRAFLTRDAASILQTGFDAVARAYTETIRIELRDASAEHGGPLGGHHSHQSGRDIDIAYYRSDCAGRTCALHRTSPEELDADRQWALLVPWLRADLVDYVFIDHALQAPLYRAAQRAGATHAELARWFQYPSEATRHVGVIRHADGHRDHLHIRFACAAHDQQCGPRRHLDAGAEPEAD